MVGLGYLASGCGAAGASRAISGGGAAAAEEEEGFEARARRVER
jgi:hypothetical protein